MFIFLDTETTGNGPDDRLCQIAFKPEGGPVVCELFSEVSRDYIEWLSGTELDEHMAYTVTTHLGLSE